MNKSISNLKKNNPQLIKSLTKYIFIVTIMILAILFLSQLYQLDSYRYYSKMDNKLMLNEVGDINKDRYNLLKTELADIEKELIMQGIEVAQSQIILRTSIELFQSHDFLQKSVIIAKDETYLEGVNSQLKWIFKNEFSPNGIYINKNTYEDLGHPDILQAKIYGSSDKVDVVVNGVYEILPSKYIFYSESDQVNDYVIVNQSLFESISTSRKYSSHIVLTTKKNITQNDIMHFEMHFDNITTGIQNYNNSLYLIEALLVRLSELIWVIFISIILLTFIMIYRYVVEIHYVVQIFRIFYLNKFKIFLLYFLSAVKIVIKPFLIPIVFFSFLYSHIHIVYNYQMLDMVKILYMLSIFIVYIFVLSLINSFKPINV